MNGRNYGSNMPHGRTMRRTLKPAFNAGLSRLMLCSRRNADNAQSTGSIVSDANKQKRVFSERELTFTFAICYRRSVCRLSVTFVRPTQAVQIFDNISTALGTLAIRGHPLNILRRSSQGNPSAGGVKDKRGSQM